MQSFAELRNGLTEALLGITAFVRADRLCSSELPDGRRRFFGSAEAGAGVEPAAAQRFLEWFCLDRRVEGAGGPPIAAFLAGGCPGLAVELRPFVEGLARSRVGVYLVTEASKEGIELEDALDRAPHEVLLSEAEARPRRGDTVLGRLVPIHGAAGFLATEAAEVARGPALFEAVVEEAQRRKLAMATEGAGVDPVELEALLRNLGPARDLSVDELEAALASLLEGAQGLADLPTAAVLSHALSEARSPGPVVDPLLEALAFESEVDLDEARRLLLTLWQAHKQAQLDEEMGESPERAMPAERAEALEPAAPALAKNPTGAEVLAQIDKGLERGEDVEELFTRVERELGIEPDPSDREWQTEEAGDLGDLAEEFLWERPREGSDPRSAALPPLVEALEALGADKVEEIEAAQLGRAIGPCFVEGRAVEGYARLVAWCAFEEWLRETQALELRSEGAQLLALLRADAERVETVRAALLRPEEPVAVERLTVLSGSITEGWTLGSAEAGVDDVVLPAGLDLRKGDLLVGSLAGKGRRAGSVGFARGLRVLSYRLTADPGASRS